LFTTPSKIATVSVINDLVTDHRVYKTCLLLRENNFKVNLIGRQLPNSLSIPTQWSFRTHRMKLIFKKGVLFYLFFNLRLFFKLLFTKSSLLVANDLDTLLPNYLVSRLKGIPLIYDSHEAFCEVPELQETPFKKKIWQTLEALIIPKLKQCITVSHSIKLYYEKRYGTPFNIVRNIPLLLNESDTSPFSLDLPKDKKIVLLQGAGININRGAEELIEAMKYTSNTLLLIIGSGDVWEQLPKLIQTHQVKEKVRLIQKIPKSQLIAYTQSAHLGISIDKNTNLNYAWSLPNKIFDYIHSEVPILATRLTEIEAIVQNYNIGSFIESHEPAHIGEKIMETLQHPDYAIWKQNLINAKNELNWKREKIVLETIIKKISE
jgi:glycosyltransferase involved in cell wall biosynthesis